MRYQTKGCGGLVVWGAETEIAIARGSGHLQKESMGPTDTGCGPQERQPRVVKREMGSSGFTSWFCFLTV